MTLEQAIERDRELHDELYNNQARHALLRRLIDENAQLVVLLRSGGDTPIITYECGCVTDAGGNVLGRCPEHQAAWEAALFGT